MPNDFSDAISAYASAPSQAAIGAINDNPDQAAKAVQLGTATGVDPSIVNGDIDHFQQNLKSTLAATIIGKNPELQNYIRNNQMAASVSNDDWGALGKFFKEGGGLDTFTQFMQAHDPVSRGGRGLIEGAAQGAEEGFGSEPLGASTDQSAMKNWNPISRALANFELDAGELAVRAGGAAFGAASQGAGGAAKGTAEAFGASPDSAGSLGRDIQGMVEQHMLSGQGAVEAPEAAGNLIRAQEAYTAAKPWIDNNLTPPRGVHPAIDEALASVNAHGVAQLDQTFAAALDSATRERSPDMFAAAASERFKNASVGISGDAVAALYGDKVPATGDGLLGFAPDIATQLDLAKSTGADVHIPVSDFLAKVDPKVYQVLHDDLRMYPEGITAREATEQVEPKALVDSPLAQVRGADGTEPMFSVGDRKISLAKQADVPGFEEFHNYDMLDETGKRVGHVEILPDEAKKQLYIANVNGLGGLYSNSFGPSLIRDLKRQLKQLYPDYETVTGHRVTGARYEAGTWQSDLANPVVKLDAPNEFDLKTDNDFRKIFESSTAEQVSKNFYAEKPTPEMLEKNADVISAVQEEIKRLTGGGVEVSPAADLADARTGVHPHGAFVQSKIRTDDADLPRIMYNLFHPDAIGTARHEAIHYLRHSGLFTSDEWKSLTKASMNEDWISRYNIDSRYHDTPRWIQNEESIAEAYRDWAANKDTLAARLRGETPITQIFRKMQQLWENIKSRVAQIFGREPTYQELFQSVHQGDVGNRMSTAAGEHAQPLFQTPEPITPKDIDDQLDNVRAQSLGLDIKTYKTLQTQIKERYAQDLEAAKARAEREQKKRQTAEWKANKADIQKEVSATIRQRPDVAADLFLGSGDLYGQKLDKKYRLATGDLSEEQQAALPNNYQAKSGLPIDGVAKMFGYQSGDELVNRLVAYNTAKGDRTPQEMVKQTIDDETNRQMEAKYGDLGENIIHEAQDQAYSDHNVNLIAEEYQAASMKAGITPIDKAMIKAQTEETFGKLQIGNIKPAQFIATVGKHSRDVERSLIGGDPAAAMVSLQKKYMTALMVNQALKLSKEVSTFDKTARRLGKANLKTIDPEYQNWIQEILPRIGKKVARAPWDVQGDIAARSSQTLADFAQEKSEAGRVMDVADFLQDPKWSKEYKSLTVDEFHAVKGSIDTLAHNGRDERKINREGEQADLDDVKARMLNQFSGMTKIHYNENTKGERGFGPISPKFAEKVRAYKAMTVQMETLLNAFDHFDKDGLFNQYVMRDLIQAANRKDADIKEYAGKLMAADDKVDLKKAVDNKIFKDQINNEPLPMTRANLRVAILNAGNESSLTKFAGGYKLSPDIVRAWIDQHATKEDWDWAQKVWDIFGGIKDRVDTTYRSMSGVAPGSVKLSPIDTPHGKYAGGYYPIIWHETFDQKSKSISGEKALLNQQFVSAMPSAKYIKERTKYFGPMSLDLDAMPAKMMQQIHDYAMRPALVNASKIFFDGDVRNTVAKYWGTEYRDLLRPYLQDVANSSNYMSAGDKALKQLTDFFRENMVTTLIGVNPGTIVKHGFTALNTSIKEVGPKPFMKAAMGLFKVDEGTSESNYQFAMNNSLELQRRHQNFSESLYGATKLTLQPNKFDTFRQFIRDNASKPIALADKLSALPTWLAQYDKSMAENGGVHGDAVYDADRAVRRAHGSTAITNQTAIIRTMSPWLTSFYNFFSDMVNRQMETVWKSGEALKMSKEGDKASAMGMLPEIIASVFAYSIVPAIIEHVVSPPQDKDSWGEKAAKGMISYESAGWVVARDLVSAVMNGNDPSLGIGGSALRTVADAFNDAFKHNNDAKVSHQQKMIEHAGQLAGLLTGAFPAPIGRAAAFGYGVARGTEHPQSPWDWIWTGPKYGTLKGHQNGG